MSNSPISHAPDLSAILPHTRGTFLQNQTSQVRKSNQVEEVFGIKWYPYYVRNNKSLALCDMHNETRLLRMFNVCFNIPKFNQEKSRRFFAAFNSPLDFLAYIKQIPQSKWAFFEYILGDAVQKLYFDIDVAVADFQQAVPGENVDTFCAELIDMLVQQIDETFDDRGVQLDLSRHILIFSSHAAHKRSFHLVVNEYAVMNHRENYVLANEVLEQMPAKYLQFVDTGMWTSKQQFRLYLSQKPDSNRPKVFVPEWYCNGQLIHSTILDNLQLPDDPQAADGLRMTSLFMASCVTCTQNCEILSETLPADHELTRSGNYKDTVFDDDVITPQVVEQIQERAPTALFEIYGIREVKGSLIDLARKKPAYCTLCKRQHDNDNAFLTINPQGYVYFHCHGTRRHLSRDSAGNLLGETRKYVANVNDLVPTQTQDIAEVHKQSLIKNLLAQIPKITPEQDQLPSTQTVHGRLKELASKPNSVIKPRKD